MAGYLSLRGHKVWSYKYEKNGAPLVLLHGGLSHSEKIIPFLLPAIEGRFSVYAFDRTGHGHTANQPGSIHFDFQRDELIAYLEDIVQQPAHLIGVSDGGNIALMVAIARPDLVLSIITIGANTQPEQVQISFEENPTPSHEDRAEHLAISPDAPEEFDKKIAKAFEVWKSEPRIAADQLARIACPTLIMAGDDDVLSTAHSNEIFESIENGRLAIIPGASHSVIKEKTNLVQHVIVDFYENLNYPITRDPVRRRFVEIELG